MKLPLLLIFQLISVLPLVYAQPPDYKAYEFMYKKQAGRDTIVNNKAYPSQNTSVDSTDTAKVIGFAVAPLYKKQPESPLGNLLADCMRLYAQKMYGKDVDAAFVNLSAIRSYIPKGDITVGTIYKVMPYDNKIVLLTIKGTILKQFLNHQASLGGWPCSGIHMVIANKQAADVLVNNQPLEESKIYTIAVADYIANGGNQCTMLKGMPQLAKNMLYHTALIDYIASFTQAGKPVTAFIENRIVYRNE